MKTSKSFYFPARDARTGRWELVAFSGLGLAGAALSAIVVVNALHFAEQTDAAMLAESGSGPGQGELSQHNPDPVAAPTNFQHLRAVTPLTRLEPVPGAGVSAAAPAPVPRWHVSMDRARDWWNVGPVPCGVP